MTEITTPTKEEIKQLPRLAQIAFAARCARRVAPLYAYYFPKAEPEHIDAVENAVKMTERLGMGEDIGEESINSTFNTVGKASVRADNFRDGSSVAELAAFSAMNAILGDPNSIACSSSAAANAASVAAGARTAITRQMRFDFELLLKASSEEGWGDETPVAPEFLGPLWRFGVPDGFPQKRSFFSWFTKRVFNGR